MLELQHTTQPLRLRISPFAINLATGILGGETSWVNIDTAGTHQLGNILRVRNLRLEDFRLI